MPHIKVETSRTTKSNTTSLYLKIITSEGNISKALKIKLQPSQYSKKRRMIINHEYGVELNKYLNKEKVRAYNLLALYTTNVIGFAELRDRYKGQQKSIDQVIDEYLDTKSTHSARIYSVALKQYKAINGDLNISRIGLNKMISELVQDKSPATVTTYTRSIKAVASELSKLGKIKEVDLSSTIKVKRTERHIELPTTEVIIERIQTASNDDYQHWLTFLFSLATRGFYYDDITSFDIDSDTHLRHKTKTAMVFDKLPILEGLYNRLDVSLNSDRRFQKQQSIRAYGLKTARRLFETTATHINVDFNIRRKLLGHRINDVSGNYYVQDRQVILEEWQRVLKALELERIISVLDQRFKRE